MEKRYVDDFFDEGRLRLSSFANFAKHSDEQRLDTEEGTLWLFHRTYENGGQTLAVNIEFDDNAYVLCGSTIPSTPLMRKFGVDSAIIIRDVPEFVKAISTKIPGVIRTVHGVCSYQANRAIEYDLRWIDLADNSTSDPSQIKKDGLRKALDGLITDDVLFIKHFKYAKQVEYRMMWLVSDPEKCIDIHVPEAVQFCERWEDQGEWIAHRRFQHLQLVWRKFRVRWRR